MPRLEPLAGPAAGGFDSKPGGRYFCTTASGTLKASSVRTLASIADGLRLSSASAGEAASISKATSSLRILVLPVGSWNDITASTPWERPSAMAIRRIIFSYTVACIVLHRSCVALVCALSALPARERRDQGDLAPARFVARSPSSRRRSRRRAATRSTMLWAGTDEIVRRLAAGETLDIVIAPAPWIDDLTGRGWLVPGSRVDLADSGIGVAIKAGSPAIDIGSTEALRGALRKARTIMLSNGVSGILSHRAVQEMGPCRRARAQDRETAGLAGGGGRHGARRGGHRLPAGGGMARGERRDLRRAAARRHSGDDGDLGRPQQKGRRAGGGAGADRVSSPLPRQGRRRRKSGLTPR